MRLLLLLIFAATLCIPCTAARAGGGDVRISPSSADSMAATVLVSGVDLGVCIPFADMTTEDGREWIHTSVSWLGPNVELTAIAWSDVGCSKLFSDPSEILKVPEIPLIEAMQ